MSTFSEKLDSILAHHTEVQTQLSSPDLTPEDMARLGKEFSDLEPVAQKITEYKQKVTDMAEAESLLEDPDMKELASEEYYALKDEMPGLEQQIKLMLIPKDAADEKSAIVELRAGAGGDEAAIFASDLFEMYQKYASAKGWKVNTMSISASPVGGYKEVIAEVTGAGVFARLKFESGVHRVQRVPVTESGGRIHTSTATVAVLPEAEDVDIEVNESDLRIDVFRASGPGGQSVNTTDSAVRITHIPSGVVVSQQDEKSQHKNRAKAMKILKARLYEEERRRQADARAADRKGQVGTGDRSERIRTYNYPQGRITDHRINLTLHKLQEVLAGEGLDELVDALISEEQAQKLADVTDAAEDAVEKSDS